MRTDDAGDVDDRDGAAEVGLGQLTQHSKDINLYGSMDSIEWYENKSVIGGVSTDFGLIYD